MVNWKRYRSERRWTLGAAVTLMSLALSGCGPDPSAELNICQENADRFFPAYEKASVDSPRSQFIIGCMASKNYHFNFLLAGCDTKLPIITQPSCYSHDAR
jgi:hypothetical protein